MLLLSFLQEVDINKKLEEAPDNAYGIGVFIGTILPFLVLVLVAYLIYRHQKNKFKEDL